MALSKRLFRYLDHFGPSCSLEDLYAAPGREHAVALRHDVDHDLDLALELAHHEHARGMKASYFLLPTAPYWNDPHLTDKCRQLEAYGHRIGLHVNVVTQWMLGAIDDPAEELRRQLRRLRDAGIQIRAVSAHGDSLCYKQGFINYWIWRELHGESPRQREHGRSAEGIIVDDAQWQISYPEDHEIVRSDGRKLPLWQVSLAEMGLEFEASFVPCDRYWSDTGGGWTRTADPICANLSRGRHHVLIHPWWWRGEGRLFFFLSTARSGSTWLANFLDRATSCRGYHDFTLNHVAGPDGTLQEDKLTDKNYRQLTDEPETARQRIRQAQRHFSRQKGDVAEANVYLEPFLETLRTEAPEAEIVHLHRDGRDVVRSLLNRDWYASPEDDAHRAVPIEDWERLNQLERACWYYRFTQQRLIDGVEKRLSFEQMVADVRYLTAQLNRLEIIVHPLLAEQELGHPMNAAAQSNIPAYHKWPRQWKSIFADICGPVQQRLGYPSGEPTARILRFASSRHSTDVGWEEAPVHLARRFGLQAVGLRTEMSAEGVRLVGDDSVRNNAHLMLLGETWRRTTVDAGVPCLDDGYFKGHIEATLIGETAVRLFVLFYDSAGELMHKQHVATLRGNRRRHRFSFRSCPQASHFGLALHVGSPGAEAVATIHGYDLHRVRLRVPAGRQPLWLPCLRRQKGYWCA